MQPIEEYGMVEANKAEPTAPCNRAAFATFSLFQSFADESRVLSARRSAFVFAGVAT
ncbi:MAG: hypothetical protein LC623_08395 [Halobacteriales archaeon]|nr:hypothetical protein [Halobacteriales archaeon]